MKIHPIQVNHAVKHAHTAAHLTYLVLVFFESHGLYGSAAIVLAVTIVVGMFRGVE